MIYTRLIIGVAVSRDLRKYSSQTIFRLIVGALILLFLVGTGLIAWLYGSQPALMGLLCMLVALVPIGLIILILKGFDRIVEKRNKE
jgi:hypothetical protein